MHISQLQYAQASAADLLIVFWIMGHTFGAAPNPGSQWACAALSKPDYAIAPLSIPNKNHQDSGGLYTGIIVCNNPVGIGNISTGSMYCVPLGVVGFGPNAKKPSFRQQ